MSVINNRRELFIVDAQPPRTSLLNTPQALSAISAMPALINSCIQLTSGEKKLDTYVKEPQQKGGVGFSKLRHDAHTETSETYAKTQLVTSPSLHMTGTKTQQAGEKAREKEKMEERASVRKKVGRHPLVIISQEGSEAASHASQGPIR